MAVALIPLLGIAVPMIIVPAALFAKHVGRARHYRHVEQMQALKTGMPLPPSVPLPGPLSLVMIGAGVPMVCVFGGLMATEMVRRDSRELPASLAIIWGSSAFLGVCALVTALVLGLLLHRAKARTEALARDASAKPAYDRDMFDSAHQAY